MKRVIHVNQHVIRSNKKNNENNPVLTVKSYKDNIKCNGVKINGPSKLVYNPEKPLSCGAHCWIETESEVECF